MKTWYRINAAAGDTKPAEVYIYGDIGWGVSAQTFAEELKKIPADTPISLRVSSSGGDVWAGLAIYNLILARKSKVTAYVDGIAASMASAIICAAGKVVAASNSWVMIHNAWTFAAGDGDDLRKQAELLDSIRDQLAGIYEARTGKSRDEIISAMAAETWLTADDAKAFGLVDDVADPIEAAASVDVTRFRNAPKTLGASASTNNQPQQDTHTMKKLLAALVEAKLIASADCTEDAAVAQFNAARASAEEDLKTAQEKIVELEKEIERLKTAETTATQARAEVAIDAAIASGKIKDDEKHTLRAKWVASYVADEAGTKQMLASLAEQKPAATTPKGGVPPAEGTSGESTIKCRSTAEAWGKR